MLFLSFCSICPLIAYFLKKNYSLRQNILKNMRVWERSLTLVLIGVYLDLIQVETRLGTGSVKELWRFTRKDAPDAAPDAVVQRPVSSQEVNCYRRSDRTLRLCVRSGRASASGHSKKEHAVLTGLSVHPSRRAPSVPVPPSAPQAPSAIQGCF